MTEIEQIFEGFICKVCYRDYQPVTIVPYIVCCNHHLLCGQCFLKILSKQKKCPFCKDSMISYFDLNQYKKLFIIKDAVHMIKLRENRYKIEDRIKKQWFSSSNNVKDKKGNLQQQFNVLRTQIQQNLKEMKQNCIKFQSTFQTLQSLKFACLKKIERIELEKKLLQSKYEYLLGITPEDVSSNQKSNKLDQGLFQKYQINQVKSKQKNQKSKKNNKQQKKEVSLISQLIKNFTKNDYKLSRKIKKQFSYSSYKIY